MYRADTETGPVVVKHYFRTADDPRNRFMVETRTLSMLWRHGVREIPRLLAADQEHGLAVLEFIDDGNIPAGAIDARDIDLTIRFVERLRDLRSVADCRDLPAASESCFSLADVESNLRARAARLGTVEVNSDSTRALARFMPHWHEAANELLAQAQSTLEDVGIAHGTVLPHTRRTLSPSDFGFHNAKRRGEDWVFFDFEYFGWDDPAKMIADFVLHPAATLNDACRRQFVRLAVAAFDDDATLPSRLRACHPLFALKWCLIVLNEFVAEFLARRRFAQAVTSDSSEEMRIAQLEKARRLLAIAQTPLGAV